MKHLPALLLRILTAAGILAAFISCVDDDKFALDDKLVTDVDINPGAAAPMAHGSYTIADFLKEKEDTLIYDETKDSLIKFVFSDDSVYNFSFDDFYETPDIPQVSKSTTIGTMSFPTEEAVYTTVNLSQIADSTGNPQLNTLINTSGETQVNGFALTDIGSYSFTAAGNFISVTVESGQMIISLTNHTSFPVYIKMKVLNSNGFPLFDGLRLPESGQVAPGVTETVYKDLAGKTMTQEMFAQLTEFGTNGTDEPVEVNGSDSLFIRAQTSDITVAGGEVIADSVEHSFSTDTLLDFSSEEADAELTELAIKSGTINVDISSGIGMDMVVNIKLPMTFRNGNTADTLIRDIAIPAREDRNEEIDLAGSVTYLSPDSVAFNQIPVEVKAKSDQTTGTITFSRNDYLSVNTSFNDFEIDYIRGAFPSDTVSIDQDEIELGLDVLDRFDGGFRLTDPEFTFRMTNKGIGIPAKLNLNMDAVNDNKTQPLGYDFGSLTKPDNMDEPITQEYIINKNTSKIVDFMALPPNKVVYGGAAIINPASVQTDYTDFITGDAEVNFGFETEIPLKIATDSLKITDTLDVNLSDNIKEFEKGNLLIDYSNGMPLNLYVTLIPYNSDNNFTHEAIKPENDILLEAAQTSNAVVTTPSTGKAKIVVEGSTFQNIINSDKLILKVRMSTFEGDPAELHANYPISLKIRMNANMNFSF